VLSYYGRIDGYAPDFGPEAGGVTEVWGSPPVPMPTGIAFGTGILGGQLLITFRYCRAVFDEPAARRFADLFVEHLMKLGTPDGGSRAP
jgi:ABC-type glycerol-3-phosphate transport system substrate-binding protein